MFDIVSILTGLVSSVVLPPHRLAHTVCIPLSPSQALLCFSIILSIIAYVSFSFYSIACMFVGRQPLHPVSFCLRLARFTFNTALFLGMVSYPTLLVALKVIRPVLTFVLSFTHIAYTLAVVVARLVAA